MKSKIKISLIILLGIMLYLVTPVHGYGFNIGITSDKSVVTAGDSLTVTVSVENLDAGTAGFHALQADIKYDTNVFEEVTSSDITGLNNWSCTYNQGALVAQNSAYITEDTPICQITLRVKASVNLGDVQVGIANALVSINKTEISSADKSVTISIKNISSKNPNYKIEDRYIKGISPLTTIAEFKNQIVGTITVKNQEGNVVADTDLVGTGMTITCGTENYSLIVKGDLNGDGKISLADVSLMKMHMIKLSLLSGDYLLAADINQNGKEADIVDFSTILDVYFEIEKI